MDEPFVSKAVENYFTAIDPYFAKEVRKPLVGTAEIVGWREPGLEQGTTHAMMSMEELMDAHVNHGSTRNNMPKDWNGALSTVPVLKIEDHAKNFRRYCPDNIYISMIVAYPTKWADKLLAPLELLKDPSGVQQVVINVSDNNFGAIFPQEHVELLIDSRML
ncbi:hypothetical protein BGX24_008495 [Mortierella sp. AD032]|nr:hypothetical protein BGX24_008495 [Mortierella sp. AD032]